MRQLVGIVLMIGSLFSVNALAAGKVFSARITNNGGCAVPPQASANWVASAARQAVGVCALTFKNSAFVTAPTCVCTTETSQFNGVCQLLRAPTAGGVQVLTEQSTTGSWVDMNFHILCSE